MQSDDRIRSIYFLMQENATQFSYQGPISQDILASMGDAIKARLAFEGINARKLTRINTNYCRGRPMCLSAENTPPKIIEIDEKDREYTRIKTNERACICPRIALRPRIIHG